MHQDCRELNLVHILRIQTIDDTVGQSMVGTITSARSGFNLYCFILKENRLNFCKNINVGCNRHNDIITNLLQCLFVIFIYQ